MRTQSDASGLLESPAGDAERLSVSVIGRLSLRFRDRAIEIESRKARALLGYLAMTPGAQESRERLVGLLWSETDEEHARASLRQTLFQIREALSAAGFSGFRADKLKVGLDPDQIQIDILDILAEAGRGAAHPLLSSEERMFDNLLRDIETIDDAFRTWLLARRQALHERIRTQLEDILRPDNADAIFAREDAARALMKLDPTHEIAARLLIRSRADAGDIGGALGLYKSLWNLLEDEYDVEPSIETQELIAQIKLAQPAPAPAPMAFGLFSAGAPPAPPRADPPMKLILSVRGFDATGTRENNRYLIEGFRRELIGYLVRFREWVVRDQAQIDAGQIADGGGVGEYILDASAFESGDGVRLVLMLRDAATNNYLWSERFQLTVDRWFDAQQSIVRRLSTALHVSLSAGRLDAVVAAPAGDQIAYDLWLQAQAVIRGFDLKGWRQAIGMMQEITERYPNFAPAYSSLAQLHNVIHIAMPGVFREAALTDQALQYARQAGRLDPIDSRSQLCLGWSYAMAMQPDQSETHARLAYELNESDHWTLASASTCLAFCGALEESNRLERQLLTLPIPLSPAQWTYLATNRFLAGDYEGCVAAAIPAGDANVTALGFQAAAHHHLGQNDAAEAAKNRLFESVRGRWSADIRADDEAVTRWFLHLFPIRRDEDWRRLCAGMAGAGAPPVDLDHNRW